MLRLDTAADALQALLQGRGDAYAHDATTLVSIQAHHPELRLIGEPFAISEAAVGLRKGEPEWKTWIDAALAKMKTEKLYLTWLAKYVPADQLSFYKRAFTEPTPKGR
jgi:polar amino acid transport system substrate-binding protein